MLTGYANEAELTRALPALHELLQKPCSAAVVRAAIERHLDRCAAGGEDG